MKETNFHPEIVDSLINCGAWGYKIPDIPFNMRNSFCPKKPCDILCAYKSRSAFIEAKMIKEWKAFGIGMLEDSQKEAGKLLVEQGQNYFIFLNVRIKADPMKEIKYENRLIIFTYQDIMNKGKNFRAEELKKLPFIPGNKGIFDLSGFLKELTLEF